jgi:hypothetical protein
MTLGDQGALYDVSVGMTALLVDVGRLSREERKEILQRCQAGRRARLTGQVADVMYQKGIIAKSITFNKVRSRLACFRPPRRLIKRLRLIALPVTV